MVKKLFSFKQRIDDVYAQKLSERYSKQLLQSCRRQTTQALSLGIFPLDAVSIQEKKTDIGQEVDKVRLQQQNPAQPMLLQLTGPLETSRLG